MNKLRLWYLGLWCYHISKRGKPFTKFNKGDIVKMELPGYDNPQIGKVIDHVLDYRYADNTHFLWVSCNSPIWVGGLRVKLDEYDHTVDIFDPTMVEPHTRNLRLLMKGKI